MKLERIPWAGPGSPDAVDLRAQLEKEGFDPFRWQDSPGADYQPHTHDHDEGLWLIAGQITFGIEGDSYALFPGDRLMLPRGTVHTALAGPDGADYWIGQRKR